MKRNNIYIVIDPMVKSDNHYSGYLRSIPLLKEWFKVKSFTFISGLNRQFPPFEYNYILLNKDSDLSTLQEDICQIINQDLEFESDHNITHSLYQYFNNFESKINKLIYVFESVKFKLKFENNLEDKPFAEDKGLIHVINYSNLLRKQFSKEGQKLPLNIERKTGNYIIQKLALEYKEKMGKNVKYLADLFDFNEIYSESVAWDMLLHFAKTTNELNYANTIRKYLRTYIESDITKISQNFYDALKTKNFNYKKIHNWRLNQCQK